MTTFHFSIRHSGLTNAACERQLQRIKNKQRVELIEQY